MNVLIVEDNSAARKLLRITFEHYKCTVIEAEDGVEGLELAARHKPDIIISDALMPRMDGFQLLRALKVDPELKSIPFVFYSSTYTGEKEIELALSLGAETFVSKPVEPAVLWEKTCSIMNDWEARQRKPAHQATGDTDEQYLREYSRIVANKLEEKVHELEEELALRAQAEEELRRLNAELTREIDERGKAERALREQEEELAMIFEAAPFIMLLLDGERKVCRANGMAYSFTGTAISDMIGRRSGEALRCLHSVDSPEGCGSGISCRDCNIRKTVMDTFESGNSHHQVETSLPFSVQGKEQTIQFLLSTTKVMVGRQTMVLISLQDISEYKKLEAELRHVQKMESIGTMAGGIAHDFNNILTVIIGYSQIALLKMSDDDSQQENVKQILASAERAANLTRDLLLFSRKKVGDKKNEDLNDIVRSLEKFLHRIIGEDIACTVNPGNEAMPILADAHQIEQVLMNFATNARDAMPNGGSLSIATERIQLDEEDITSLGCGECGEYAVLTVTDTGIGMDDKTRQQIFDPFFTTKEVGKGTGLGLAVVYGIIRQHDGQITVDSEPGHGTTFRVYLPVTRAAAKENKIDQNHKQSVRGAETILLAEDEESLRNMSQSLLESFGYTVISAVDGEDAVKKFRENRKQIRLLLFDVVMPKKNGIDAYDEIRAIKPDIKVIFASGYSTEAVQQKALTNENVISIAKPYLPSNLLALVRSVLDKK
ncbi:MAG: response regulator [Desulfuromonadaceae bacterium]|nr:response regulator [Desulfuromonadaceae bacterium]